MPICGSNPDGSSQTVEAMRGGHSACREQGDNLRMGSHPDAGTELLVLLAGMTEMPGCEPGANRVRTTIPHTDIIWHPAAAAQLRTVSLYTKG